MYIATQQFLIFEFSAEDITSAYYYRFLLRLVNIFTIDTDTYYPMCYKVMMPRLLRILNSLNSYIIYVVLCFVLTQITICMYCRLARFTWTFKITLI